MVKLRMRCPGCGLPNMLESYEDGYRCIACGAVFVPPRGWVGPIWAEEQRYKRSISRRGRGSRKAGRKRSRKKRGLDKKTPFEGAQMQ